MTIAMTMMMVTTTTMAMMMVVHIEHSCRELIIRKKRGGLKVDKIEIDEILCCFSKNIPVLQSSLLFLEF